MAFANVLFPRNISYGSQGGPEFSTTIIASGSKREQRNRNLYQPVYKWNVIYGIKKLSDYLELYNFFLARAGKWQAFLFEDPMDNTLALETVALGDGVQTVFQATATNLSGPGGIVRNVTKFAPGTKVYLDNVEQITTTLDPLTGLITFAAPPALGAVIAVSGGFYFTARFDTDYLPAISDARGNANELIMRIENIPIVEAPGE